MDISEAFWLGVLQGIAEFLPISSSGHMALLRAWCGIEGAGAGALFEVLLHIGSAAAIIIVFRERLGAMLAVTPQLMRPAGWKPAWAGSADFRLALLVLLGSVPAGIVGVGFGDSIESLFDAPRFIGVMQLVTGTMLLCTRFVRLGEAGLGVRHALIVGIAQAIAVMPGISRSGSTISAGLVARVERSRAGEYSFLLGLVAILGANLLEARHVGDALARGEIQPLQLIVGVVTSFLVSWITLRWLVRFIARGQLWVFGPWCLAVGIAALLWL